MQAIMKSLSIILLLASLSLASNALSNTNRRQQQNFFDPIYAYDDIDAHTVSAGSSSNQDQRVEPRPRLSFDSHRPTFNSAASATRRPTAPVSKADIFLGTNRASPSTSSRSFTSSSSSISTGPALVTPKFSVSAPATSASSSSSVPIARVKKEDQAPARHWSALENYYQKLRQQAGPTLRVEQPASLVPYYQMVQQEAADDIPLSGYKQIQSYSPSSHKSPSQQVYIIPNSNPSPQISQQTVSAQPKPNPAFMLPLADSLEADRRLFMDNLRPDFSVYQPEAPGIGRKVAGSQQSSAEQQAGIKSNFGGSSVVAGPTSQFIQPPAYYSPSSSSPMISEGGKIKYLEWRKLPELLLLQQQQQRVKHQQETFGDWYDHQRTKEQLQEEAFCGPRNYINFHFSPTGQIGSANSSEKQRISPIQLSRIHLQLQHMAGGGSSAQLDVPVTLSADEYPSHMGVYNGSSPSEDNFLCSASWINERFALTLASCVRSVSDPKTLTVRAGEWNLDKIKEKEPASSRRPLIVRQVEQVFVFPRYRNDSGEHNLALIKFDKPVDYLEVPYVCPACQLHSRTSIRASSCWTPVRNVTLSEYFDADGEGETKEKKNVNMIELPVRLIANDDSECYRKTKVEFFNFQHPNYICSGDFQTQDGWRTKLNQTDYFGSGIYCNEGGNLSLVSILHPIFANTSSAIGYMDLSYYKPWMRKVISGLNF